LNCKKNKVDEYSRKPHTFSKQELLARLSTAANNEYVKDESCTKPMSESLVGGSMNVCKIRVLNVQPERTVQGLPSIYDLSSLIGKAVFFLL